MRRHEIIRDFKDGYVAALQDEPRRKAESDHWIHGWDCGWLAVSERDSLLNEHLRALADEARERKQKRESQEP